MAKIKQFQAKSQQLQRMAQDQFVAVLFIRVEKQGTQFEAAGSIIDVANGLLTAAGKNPGIRSAFLLAASELGRAMGLESLDDFRSAASAISRAINEQSKQSADQTEEE